jgi:pyridoxal phosphate enzyme (YggS family)
MTQMSIDIEYNLTKLKNGIPKSVSLLAVSKTKPIELIQIAYDAGQRNFGENKVQELRDKYPALPKDIKWHMIGHLQSNKVKYIAPFIYMIHAVDSIKLLHEINKRAQLADRKIRILLQVYIAKEEAKFGFETDEIYRLFEDGELEQYKNIIFSGLMGMATNTQDMALVKREFSSAKMLINKIQNEFPQFNQFNELSIGMSNDYLIAIEEGSTMIRIGSSIFGSR